jgi:hypothetical protein
VKDKGYVKTHRSIMDWEWYKVPNTNILFKHCILRANFEDTKWRGIEVKRGSFITSLNTLSEETGLTVQNVRTALKNLELTNDLTSKSHSKYRIVTVNNYCEYQATNKQDNKQLTSNQQGANKQLTTDKELKEPKNLKNVIKKIYIKLGKYNNVKLTQKEYDKLKSEHNNIDSIIDWFSAYIEEKDYKSKSHNLTIRRWVIDACSKNNKSNSDIDDMTILYNKYKEEEDEQERNS